MSALRIVPVSVEDVPLLRRLWAWLCQARPYPEGDDA